MGESQDEVDRYIASLIEGTDYAKRRDHEARLRLVAKCYGVTMGDVRAIQRPMLAMVEHIVSKALTDNAAAFVAALREAEARSCQPPRHDGAHGAERHTPPPAPNVGHG